MLFRNKEVQIFVLIMGLIGVTGVIISSFISSAAAILIFIISSLMTVCSLLFTNWRYGEIKKLSGYLRQISSGDYSLDVRDNYEGELSILKNDIYKVTAMLAEQSSFLQEDKIQLTNAISDISHQLKTPLTSMMIMTDLLRDSKLPINKRTEFTHNIRIQLERIEWLVSSLLKLSKIDAGTAYFKREHVLVKELIAKALEPLGIPMEIKEQSICVTGEASVSFTGDRNWTTEALINILKNCVEHTPQGGTITISFSENPLFTELIINDNGIGIAKEDLPYIFKRFYKGKNATEGNIGIGLAMAHSIITNQKGDIEVSSEKDKGTQFRIKFYKQVL